FSKLINATLVIKHMLWTTVPAAVVSIIIYVLAGFNLSTGNVSTPATMTIMLDTLNKMFDWNLLLLLSPIIILYGSIRKKPTLSIIILSSMVAALFGLFYQGATGTDVSASAVSGFDISMIQRSGFDAANVTSEVTDLVNQGGMESMADLMLIAFRALVFAGILTVSGSLDVIITALMKVVKRTGVPILATVLSCITMALVTGNSYLSIIVPGEIYKDTYQKNKLKAKNLSRTLEDS